VLYSARVLSLIASAKVSIRQKKCWGKINLRNAVSAVATKYQNFVAVEHYSANVE
jgi:hypothetical protein